MAIPGIRSDPFPAFNFYISLLDSSSTLATLTSVANFVLGGGFSECSGLEATMQMEEYSEGGENRFVHKFFTRMTYANIVLKRGVTLSEDLWNWHSAYVQGQGKRRDGVIIMQNELKIPVKTWIFKSGLPMKWAGPSFNASQSNIAIETLEIAHQGLELLSAGTALAQVGNAIGSAF